jgi:hypothetical protein
MVGDVLRGGPVFGACSVDNRVPEAKDESVSCVGKYTRQGCPRFLGPSLMFEFGLTAHQRTEKEEKVCRTFGNAPHEIWVPGRAIGHVGAHAIALLD